MKKTTVRFASRNLVWTSSLKFELKKSLQVLVTNLQLVLGSGILLNSVFTSRDFNAFCNCKKYTCNFFIELGRKLSVYFLFIILFYFIFPFGTLTIYSSKVDHFGNLHNRK